MPVAKLNRSKPFGEICGVSATFPTARYHQKGLIFDVHGICLNPQDSEVSSIQGTLERATPMDTSPVGKVPPPPVADDIVEEAPEAVDRSQVEAEYESAVQLYAQLPTEANKQAVKELEAKLHAID